MGEVSPSKYTVHAGWDDVPHLDPKAKAELLRSSEVHLRKARSTGIPSLGEGAIYPIEPEEFLVDPFAIPRHWFKGYAMDVGWRRTAAIWGAYDRSTDTLYLYTEHYRGQAEPSIHAAAIKARGIWIPGRIDPAARQRSQIDGRRLMALYEGQGLHLTAAANEVESGIYAVWERLSTGRLKVFRTLQNFQAEYRTYRREKKDSGRVEIVKSNDHLMDCMRYLISSGLDWMKQEPVDPAHLARNFPIGDPRLGY